MVGHLEFGETVFETAKREVVEETDLDVAEFELVSVCDEMHYIKTDNKHYLNLGVLGKYQGGESQVMEPEKCQEWKWFSLNALPEIFLKLRPILSEISKIKRFISREWSSNVSLSAAE